MSSTTDENLSFEERKAEIAVAINGKNYKRLFKLLGIPTSKLQDNHIASFFSNDFYTWCHRQRIVFLLKKYGIDFWKDKRVLELGGSIGTAANSLNLLGSRASVWEGRQDVVDVGKILHPNVSFKVKNLETDCKSKIKFDVVLNWGVLYHISPHSFDNFMKNSFDLVKPGGVMLIDTNVYPISNEQTVDNKIAVNENSEILEHAVSGTGTLVTPEYIVKQFTKFGAETIERVKKELDEIASQISMTPQYEYDDARWPLGAVHPAPSHISHRAWFTITK